MDYRNQNKYTVRTKWCPFARPRLSSPEGGTHNSNREGTYYLQESACLIEMCAVWVSTNNGETGYCGLIKGDTVL